jgi:hypothetical protein
MNKLTDIEIGIIWKGGAGVGAWLFFLLFFI